MMVSSRRMAAAAHHASMQDDAPVRAILGPTNTGKTHLALERMLAHSSGMIGFPLRLLARENYERMVKLKGVRSVGLITGEEKIIPPQARWFSCTVEAMPSDRKVEFVAVDEIQLCADPERGHVFTDRLLNARGRSETLFLGAETIAPLLKTLIRDIEIDTRPRLSNLTYTGHMRLSRLPARTAIVAFSMAEVYAIAELIRRKRGGCAVVMGQLSPRTRNAQVALYQNREVDYLVATDAIGMGLNMDIRHIAFANICKFDGYRNRLLTPAEAAQIAGRAGRGTQDGTFGTTGECPAFPEGMVEAIETHHFEPLPFLWWRNSKLNFTSPSTLYASLCQKPPDRCLKSAAPASDLLALSALMQNTTVQKLAHTPARTQLLWEVCQIPDFRKLGEDSHIRLCEQIFTLLAQKGHLPSAWMKSRLANLEQLEGDIDVLMQRLMGIRTWSYVSARPDWVENAAHWRNHTLRLEDALSDVLHERLTTRFVDKRAASLARRLEEADTTPLLSAITRTGEVSVEGHAVGHMRGFSFTPDPEAAQSDQKLILKAARRAARNQIPYRVSQFLQAPDTEITLNLQNGALNWQEDTIARLQAGADVLHPVIEVREAEFLEHGQKEKIRQRLAAFVDAYIHKELAPLFRAEKAVADQPLLRGMVHMLVENGGVAEVPHLSSLPTSARHILKRLHITQQKNTVFCSKMMRPSSMALRALLLSLHSGIVLPELPRTGAVSAPVPALLTAPQKSLLMQLGWIISEGTLIRLDIAAALYAESVSLISHGSRQIPNFFASRLGVKKAILPGILRSLGLHVQKPQILPDTHAGPPAPFLIIPQKTVKNRKHSKKRTGRVQPEKYNHNSPFAVLATLRQHHQP